MSFGNRLYDCCMAPLERAGIREMRTALMGNAAGRVLELGAGSGANCAFYDFNRIERLVVSDREISSLLGERADACGAESLAIDVASIPFEADSFDCVVFSLLFCSVEDPAAGLAEIDRVLAPGGTVIFIEHVLGCSPLTRALQNGLTPIWRRIAGNCHLNRDTAASLRAAGFRMERRVSRAGCILTGGIARR